MLKTQSSIKMEKTLLVNTLKKIGVMVDVKTHNIFTNVLIEVVGNEILFTSINQKNHFVVAKIENEWNASDQKLLVSHKELNDFIKKAKSDFIDISVLEDNKVNINAGKINYKLVSNDVSDFPIMPIVEFEKVELDINDFSNAMKNTCFAVSKSESRPVLQAVNIKYDSNGLKMIATDSHRLAQYKMDYKTDNEYNSTPDGKLLEKIGGIVGKNTKTVMLGFHEDYMAISFDDVEYWIKNIEGNYPDTSRLIPESFNTFMNVNGNEILETLSTFELITKKIGNSVITLDNGKSFDVELSCKDDDYKKNMDSTISTWKNEGEKISISYNSEFFKDALKALNSVDININVVSQFRPFIITTNDNKNALHLILPVRTT